MQQPSIGRIVHYILPTPHVAAGAHCAALIVAVGENSLTLKVWKPDGEEIVTVNPPHQDLGAGTAAHAEFGTWHWPERV